MHLCDLLRSVLAGKSIDKDIHFSCCSSSMALNNNHIEGPFPYEIDSVDAATNRALLKEFRGLSARCIGGCVSKNSSRLLQKKTLSAFSHLCRRRTYRLRTSRTTKILLSGQVSFDGAKLLELSGTHR